MIRYTRSLVPNLSIRSTGIWETLSAMPCRILYVQVVAPWQLSSSQYLQSPDSHVLHLTENAIQRSTLICVSWYYRSACTPVLLHRNAPILANLHAIQTLISQVTPEIKSVTSSVIFKNSCLVPPSDSGAALIYNKDMFGSESGPWFKEVIDTTWQKSKNLPRVVAARQGFLARVFAYTKRTPLYTVEAAWKFNQYGNVIIWRILWLENAANI